MFDPRPPILPSDPHFSIYSSSDPACNDPSLENFWVWASLPPLRLGQFEHSVTSVSWWCTGAEILVRRAEDLGGGPRFQSHPRLTFQSCSRYQLNIWEVKPHQNRPSKSRILAGYQKVGTRLERERKREREKEKERERERERGGGFSKKLERSVMQLLVVFLICHEEKRGLHGALMNNSFLFC